MSEKKIKFVNIKIGIFSFLIFIFVAFAGGYFLADYFKFKNKKKDDFSLMYKVWGILDDKFLDTRKDQSEKITREDNIEGAIAGLVASYRDPYTVFLPAKESKDLEDEISGEFGGIGVEIENRSGFLTVVSPLPGTPAAKAGLKPKDIIVEIDGKDSIDISSYDASVMIRGKPGTVVKLKVARRGEAKPLDIEVERALISVPIVKTYSKDGVFVIKIFSFTETAPKLFFDAVKEFKKSGNKKLIIDLRGNPGGHLFAAVYMAGMFLPEGTTIVTEEYGSGEKEVLLSGEYHKTENSVNVFGKNILVAVLVDGGSASAAEILAGALHDNNRAVLMGENTYGKGTVQELKKLGGGNSLKVTIARWVMPLGDWISHTGIPVDIEVSISDKEAEEARSKGTFTDDIDPQLERAIGELKKIKNQEELKKIIEEKRKERKKDDKKDREEKIKRILGQ